MKQNVVETKRDMAIAALGLALTLTFPGPVSAKWETVRMTITGSDLQQPAEVADRSVPAKLNSWIRPRQYKERRWRHPQPIGHGVRGAAS